MQIINNRLTTSLPPIKGHRFGAVGDWPRPLTSGGDADTHTQPASRIPGHKALLCSLRTAAPLPFLPKRAHNRHTLPAHSRHHECHHPPHHRRPNCSPVCDSRSIESIRTQNPPGIPRQLIGIEATSRSAETKWVTGLQEYDATGGMIIVQTALYSLIKHNVLKTNERSH